MKTGQLDASSCMSSRGQEVESNVEADLMAELGSFLASSTVSCQGSSAQPKQNPLASRVNREHAELEAVSRLSRGLGCGGSDRSVEASSRTARSRMTTLDDVEECQVHLALFAHCLSFLEV